MDSQVILIAVAALAVLGFALALLLYLVLDSIVQRREECITRLTLQLAD